MAILFRFKNGVLRSPKYYDNILSIVTVFPPVSPIRKILALFTVIDHPADVLTEVSPQSSVAGNAVAFSRVFMQKIIMSLFAVLHSLMRLASGVTHLDLNPLLFHNSLRLPGGRGVVSCRPLPFTTFLYFLLHHLHLLVSLCSLCLPSAFPPSFLAGFLSLYYTLSHFLHFSHFKPSLLPHPRQPSVSAFLPPLTYLSVFKLFPLGVFTGSSLAGCVHQ